MRYYSKKVYISEAFYSMFSSPQSYKEYVEEFVDAYYQYVDGFDSTMQFIYKGHIESVFNENVMFYDELKDIIYENNELKLFDENVYSIIRSFNDKFRNYMEHLYEDMEQNRLYIESIDIPFIKNLSLLNKHDANLKVNYQKPFLEIVFDGGYCGIEMLCFELTKDLDFKFLEEYTVIFEEIYQISEDIFEYNILLWGTSDLVYEGVREVTIEFKGGSSYKIQ